jgi:hypothetical protein
MFLKRKNLLEPEERGIYSVLKGTFSGEFFVYITKKENGFLFFSLPDFKERLVPSDSFVTGINCGVLEFIERLPKNIFQEVELQHKKINNSNGLRRTQENNKPYKRTASGAQNSNKQSGQQDGERSSLD